MNLSNTLLQDNLTWCEVTAYVSSTVALESLMRGKPVVNFSIADVVSSDPLCGMVPFYWSVSKCLEMVDVLVKIHHMSMSDYEEASLRAVAYARDYLSPIDDVILKKFSDTLLL